MAKPLIATQHLTSCFGCHMSILDIDERILKLAKMVDFDRSPINDIKDFRKNCKILIGIGACAVANAVPSMRNTVPLTECLEEAFLKGPTITDGGVIPNDEDLPILLDRVYPLHEVVKIDYFLPGCPPSADTIWNALVALLTGKPLEFPYELIKYD
jgi:NAD-reducing hydrogenase small subunit